jgi:hypothetical protein
MVSFLTAVRMAFSGNGSLHSKIIGLLVYIIAEAAFIAFLGWVFFATIWYLEN